MKRYRKEFKQAWERVVSVINLNVLLSEKGEVEGGEGQTYKFRYLVEVCKMDKNGELKKALGFGIEVRFNVTDITQQVKMRIAKGRK